MQLQKEKMLGYWCVRLAHILKAQVESRFGSIGLTAPEAGILVHVSRLGTTSLVELARELQHAHPSVLRHLDNLEKRELVQRTPHPTDRRIKQVELTAAGRELVPQLTAAFIETQRVATAGLNPEDVACTLAVLRQIVETFDGCAPYGSGSHARAGREVDDGS